MPPATPIPPAQPDVWVRFLETVDPTPTDRMRYEAGSVWAVPAARAESLISARQAARTAPPEAALRIPTEPLEPPSEEDTVAVPTHTADVAEEEE